MAQDSIFWPMIAMALLTFVPLGMMAVKRVRATQRGVTVPEDYALGKSPRVPADVALANRSFMNTLEVPVLFHVLSLALYVTHGVDLAFLSLAWAYVALRCAHSLVHLTYNRVTHRLVPFATSNAVLIAMWVIFAIRLSRHGPD